MSHRLRFAAGFAACVFMLSARAGVVPNPVGEHLSVEVAQPQQEIAIDVPTTATGVGMQFGLIGGLIGSAVQNSQAKGAEQRVVPVRDALIGYDFNARLEAALRAKLGSAPHISGDPRFLFLTPAATVERDQARAELASTALVLTPRYSFDYEMTTLTVKVAAQYVERQRKGNGKYKLTPRVMHAYAFYFPLANPDKTAAPWTALGRTGLADLLDEGIAQVVDMLLYDFTEAGRLEWDQNNAKQFARLNGHAYPGMPIRQEAGYVWVRKGRNFAQSIEGWQPVDGPIVRVAAAARPDAAGAAAQAVSASAPAVAPATAAAPEGTGTAAGTPAANGGAD